VTVLERDEGMVRVAGEPVFTVADQLFSWSDVVVAAQLNGDWLELERATAQSLACLARLTAVGEELDGKKLAEAEVRFRRAYRLLSGEETVEWLTRWQLAVSDWRDYLRRTVARERWPDELDQTVQRFPVPIAEVAVVLWTEAVCSGFLDDAAHRLAGEAALAAQTGVTLAGEREQALDRIAVAAEGARALSTTAEAVAREIASHRLEWRRVEGLVAEFPTEDMAREAAYCVSDDGRLLADVAAECEVDARPLRVYLGEAEHELAPLLLAVDEDELVGPFPSNDAFALIAVERRICPSPTDPDVRRKATERLTARLVERAIAARVTWHGLD
jgi:hypothetical protein